MKSYEKLYSVARLFLPVVYMEVRKRLLSTVGSYSYRPEILDVGGRKSHYTIGVPAFITISDLRRISGLQHTLHLGLNDELMAQLRSRRSNVRQVVYDDMTGSRFPDSAFDCVVSVEVLEHVEEDQKFIEHVHRVLKPGGVFIMTTPNGDFLKVNTNPDHKRHYTRAQLIMLLQSQFHEVEVVYAVRSGKCHVAGLRSWSPRHPVGTACSMLANVINTWQSRPRLVRQSPNGTHHLIATAKKEA
jgi:SAM-dependent methyltransferase